MELDCRVRLDSQSRQIRSVRAGSGGSSFVVRVSTGNSYQAVKTCTFSGGTVSATSNSVDL